MAAGREEAEGAFGFLLVLGQGSDSRRAWVLSPGWLLKLS